MLRICLNIKVEPKASPRFQDRQGLLEKPDESAIIMSTARSISDASMQDLISQFSRLHPDDPTMEIPNLDDRTSVNSGLSYCDMSFRVGKTATGAPSLESSTVGIVIPKLRRLYRVVTTPDERGGQTEVSVYGNLPSEYMEPLWTEVAHGGAPLASLNILKKAP